MKKILSIIIFLILCSLIISIPVFAAEVSDDDTYITPEGIYNDYYIPIGYYSFPRFENLNTSLLTDSTNRIKGQMNASIKMQFSEGYIIGIFRFSQITISDYQTLTVSLTSSIQPVEPLVYGNVSSSEYNEAIIAFDNFMLDSEFDIYKYGQGYLFDNRITIESIKVFTPIFCNSLWDYIFDFQNLIVNPIPPTFLDIGTYKLWSDIFDNMTFSDYQIQFPFYSNNRSFNSITLDDSLIYYDDTLVYDSSGWLSDNYQYITYISSSAYILSDSEDSRRFQYLIEYLPLDAYAFINYADDIEIAYINGYDVGYNFGFNAGKEEGLQESVTSGFFVGLVDALDSLKIGPISIYDIIITIFGLFVFGWVLKLIAGG